MVVEIINVTKREAVFVPHILLIPKDILFEFKKLQFPLKVFFAITINNCQGQTHKIAGVEFRKDYFSHGQFYVACSRCKLTPKPGYFATILQNR